MARGDLAALGTLLDARKRASEAKLRQIRDRETDLIRLLNTLAATRRRTMADQHGGDAATVAYRNDIAHQRWIDQRRAAINIELAQVRALIDIAQSDLHRHFARQQALQHLVIKQKSDALLQARRRADYGS